MCWKAFHNLVRIKYAAEICSIAPNIIDLSVLESQNCYVCCSEIGMVSRLAYSLVTTGCGQQTPGEEYCDTLQAAGTAFATRLTFTYLVHAKVSSKTQLERNETTAANTTDKSLQSPPMLPFTQWERVHAFLVCVHNTGFSDRSADGELGTDV